LACVYQGGSLHLRCLPPVLTLHRPVRPGIRPGQRASHPNRRLGPRHPVSGHGWGKRSSLKSAQYLAPAVHLTWQKEDGPVSGAHSALGGAKTSTSSGNTSDNHRPCRPPTRWARNWSSDIHLSATPLVFKSASTPSSNAAPWHGGRPPGMERHMEDTRPGLWTGSQLRVFAEPWPRLHFSMR
jgi:hypothetical protein